MRLLGSETKREALGVRNKEGRWLVSITGYVFSKQQTRYLVYSWNSLLVYFLPSRIGFLFVIIHILNIANEFCYTLSA